MTSFAPSSDLAELAQAVRDADAELERVYAAREHAGRAFRDTENARIALADAYLAQAAESDEDFGPLYHDLTALYAGHPDGEAKTFEELRREAEIWQRHGFPEMAEMVALYAELADVEPGSTCKSGYDFCMPMGDGCSYYCGYDKPLLLGGWQDEDLPDGVPEGRPNSQISECYENNECSVGQPHAWSCRNDPRRGPWLPGEQGIEDLLAEPEVVCRAGNPLHADLATCTCRSPYQIAQDGFAEADSPPAPVGVPQPRFVEQIPCEDIVGPHLSHTWSRHADGRTLPDVYWCPGEGEPGPSIESA